MTAWRAARPSRRWRSKTLSSPSSSIRSSATSSAMKSDTAGVNGLSGGSLRWPFDGAVPVEVVARAAAAPRRARARARLRWRSRARAGTSAPSANRPTTTSTSHSSCGSGTAPRPEIASTTMSASCSCATCVSAWMSLSDGGRGLRERREDDLDVRVLAEQAVEVRRVDLAAPARVVMDDLRRHVSASSTSARRTSRRRRRGRLVTGLDQVRGGRLHSTRAGGRRSRARRSGSGTPP